MLEGFYAIFENIMASPIISAILAIVAIASFSYAIYCRHSPREKSELRYHRSSFTLANIGSFPMDDFTFYYKGKPIEKCVATVVSFWNNGSKVLEYSDLASKKPLAFVCSEEGAIILDARILDVTKEENDVNISVENGAKCFVSFDYLGDQDGAKLLILHTGGNNSISVEGSVKSGEQIKPMYESTNSPNSKRQLQRTILRCLLVTCIAVWILALVAILLGLGIIPVETTYSLGENEEDLRAVCIIMGIVCMALSIMSTVMTISSYRRVSQSGVPQEIRW